MNAVNSNVALDQTRVDLLADRDELLSEIVAKLCDLTRRMHGLETSGKDHPLLEPVRQIKEGIAVIGSRQDDLDERQMKLEQRVATGRFRFPVQLIANRLDTREFNALATNGDRFAKLDREVAELKVENAALKRKVEDHANTFTAMRAAFKAMSDRVAALEGVKQEAST
jgi:hypothetical protein